MAIAIPLRGVASKLMARFGGQATFRHVVNGAYNASTGTTSQTTTDTAIRGVLEDVRKQGVGFLVQADDKMMMVAAADLPTVPTIEDRILVEARVFQIINVTTIEQDNTEIMYEIVLRE